MTKRILVIESVEEIRQMLKRIFELKAADYEVIVAPDTFRALDWLLQQPFDLILMDQETEGIGYLGMAQIIHAVRPKSRILLLATEELFSSKIERKLAVFDAFLPKPFTLPELWKAIDQTLDGMMQPKPLPEAL